MLTQSDIQFFNRVASEVTQTCALPLNIPQDRLPEIVYQAAQWFWEHNDYACEERYFRIPYNSIVHDQNKLNKVVQLPNQIFAIFGVHKLNSEYSISGSLRDFSTESLIYNLNMYNNNFRQENTLTNAVATLYEIDTFDQLTNPPISYNYNRYSSKLVLLGDLGVTDIVIQSWVRCCIEDLYNSYQFFQLCVAFVKRALGNIYGTFEFKLPGGVTINYDKIASEAQEEIEQIKEWCENNRAVDYFFMSNSI